jgi:outer membrane protein TolC
MRDSVINRFSVWCLAIVLLPAAATAQSRAASEPLSLESAIGIALDNNRTLGVARRDVERAAADLAVARSRRLPSFETTASVSQLLTPVTFAFPRGAFGEYPGIGPIPSVDTDVKTPQGVSYYVSSQVSQPLSQLYRIGLGIRGAATSRAAAVERTREQELATVNAVKRSYFAIVQTRSALAANAEALALYRELDRTVSNRVAQRVSLQSESLDVRLRLAETELSRVTLENTLASQKEQLNQLLGRDVLMPFDVDALPAGPGTLDANLEGLRRRAIDERPDVRQARLKVEQADLDRRVNAAGRIPDVSLAVSYLSNFNIDALPRNLATVGIQVTWEPFDWGRRGREVAAKGQVVAQAKLAARDVEDRAALEINSRFRKLAEARATLDVIDMARNSAREKLRVATNRFQVQAALLTDVLSLRSGMAEADDRFQSALAAFWTAKADFEQAIGGGVAR